MIINEDRLVIKEAQHAVLEILTIATNRYLENPTPEMGQVIQELMDEYTKTKEIHKL